MTAILATQPAGTSARRPWALLLVGVPTLGAVVMFVVGALVQSWVAGEHGQFHALFASAFLVPALVLAIRRPHGGPAATPVIVGLAIAAICQLVEGVGGFGYGPGNIDRVNALASVHDLGLMLAPIGLVAAAIGVTFGVAQVARPRLGRLPALVLAAAIMAGLGVLIAKMVGM